MDELDDLVASGGQPERDDRRPQLLEALRRVGGIPLPPQRPITIDSDGNRSLRRRRTRHRADDRPEWGRCDRTTSVGSSPAICSASFRESRAWPGPPGRRPRSASSSREHPAASSSAWSLTATPRTRGVGRVSAPSASSARRCARRRPRIGPSSGASSRAVDLQVVDHVGDEPPDERAFGIVDVLAVVVALKPEIGPGSGTSSKTSARACLERASSTIANAPSASTARRRW